MKSEMLTSARKLAILVATLLAMASAAQAGWPLILSDGVPVSGISDEAGGKLYYEIDVPAGQSVLEISITGGTGDCDLYVRKGLMPTLTQYDYRPFQVGNEETVTVYDPSGGTWYIMLHASETYAGVTLVASLIPDAPEELFNGEAQSSISGSEGSVKVYYIDVPAGQDVLDVETWNGTGQVGIYVKYGSTPTIFDYDDSSVGGGTEQEVSISSPAAGTWYILLHGSSNYHDVSLRATYGVVGSCSTLYDEMPVSGLSGAAGSEDCYAIDVPEGQDGLMFVLSGGTGDCDMYIRKGYRPTESEYDYRPVDNGDSNESISLGGEEGRWYVLLKGDTAYSGVTLKADYWEPSNTPQITYLSNGVPVTNLSGEVGTELFFSIYVPAGVQRLEIAMSGGTGDADLFVKRGETPTTANHDYRPYKTGNDETVTVEKPISGMWYIMIRGYQPFAGITLVATYDGKASEDTPELKNGVAIPDLAGDSDSQRFYLINVPEGQDKLVIKIFGGIGDVDLYVRSGEKPTLSKWDYRPFLLGNNETVTIEKPKAGAYYIMLRGYRKYEGVTLQATYSPDGPKLPLLENCVPLTGLNGAAGSQTFYAIEVPADQGLLTIRTFDGSGDADLYIKKGAEPSITSYDYRPFKFGNEETVEVLNPAATTWHIMIYGYKAYAGLTLEVCFKSAKQ